MNVRPSFQNELLKIKLLLEDRGAVLSESQVRGEVYSPYLALTLEAWLTVLKQTTELGKGHLACDGNDHQKLRVFLRRYNFHPKRKVRIRLI